MVRGRADFPEAEAVPGSVPTAAPPLSGFGSELFEGAGSRPACVRVRDLTRAKPGMELKDR